MKLIVTILTACVLYLTGAAQDYSARFSELFEKKDTVAQYKLLKEWSAAKPKDPELFIAWFNYYVRRSVTEVISLEQGNTKPAEGYVLTDSAGNQVGSLSSSMGYNPALLQKGFDYINQGIALHPDRLDMRFGKIYMYGETENYAAFTGEIIKTIEHAQKIKYKWLWKEGKPLEDPEEFFLSSVQDYVGTIYNTEDDNLLPYMREISEAVLKYHPNHVESLTNVAITYLVKGEYDKPLPYLLRAEKVNPKDVVVLNNIAEAYKRKGDKANARIYFEKIIQHGNAEEAEDARKRMSEL